MAHIEIINGEGTGEGTVEEYTGVQTARAIRARLTRERCGGDRWAFARIDGQRAEDGVIDDALRQRKFAAYDRVTGWLSAHPTEASAELAARRHNVGCAEQGGVGHARVYSVDAEGYLSDDGEPVWPPQGRSSGAVRI
jgi:hypothetical protein